LLCEPKNIEGLVSPVRILPGRSKVAAPYTLNLDILRAAATLVGDVRSDGRLHLSRISRRSGVDTGVLSRITRRENSPSLHTLGQLADAYKLTVDKLISSG
jgi:transcriptional regulator with XRE-family HTH domain